MEPPSRKSDNLPRRTSEATKQTSKNNTPQSKAKDEWPPSEPNHDLFGQTGEHVDPMLAQTEPHVAILAQLTPKMGPARTETDPAWPKTGPAKTKNRPDRAKNRPSQSQKQTRPVPKKSPAAANFGPETL